MFLKSLLTKAASQSTVTWPRCGCVKWLHLPKVLSPPIRLFPNTMLLYQIRADVSFAVTGGVGDLKRS